METGGKGPQSPHYSDRDEAVNKIRMALNVLGQVETAEDFVKFIQTRFGTGVLHELTLDQAQKLLESLTKRVVANQKQADQDQALSARNDQEAVKDPAPAQE